MKKSARPAAPRRACKLIDIHWFMYYITNLFFWFTLVGGDRENRGPRGDRDNYRRKEGANGDFKPEFRGGLGKWFRGLCSLCYDFNHVFFCVKLGRGNRE